MPAWVPGPPQTHHSLRPDAQNLTSEFYNSHLGACPVLRHSRRGLGGCPGPHYLCNKSCGNSRRPEEQMHDGPRRFRPRSGTSSGKSLRVSCPHRLQGQQVMIAGPDSASRPSAAMKQDQGRALPLRRGTGSPALTLAHWLKAHRPQPWPADTSPSLWSPSLSPPMKAEINTDFNLGR